MRKAAVTGSLYTGVTSKSFAQVKEKRSELTRQKMQLKAEAFKNGHLIIEKLDGELDNVIDKLWTLTDAKDTEEHIKASLIALRLYKDYLTGLKSEIVMLLRPAEKERVDE